MRKIAVLTYQAKHRKTYDVLCLLKANGYTDVKIYAVPLHYQKKKLPLVNHRPEMNYKIPDIEKMCLNFGFHCVSGQLDKLTIERDRIVLIAGAGILPDEFVNSHTIINSHPGYIPNCRGLDALKWAIVENQPIGVTTHLVGEYIDAGKVIERRLIDIHETDTFHALAERVYENEVSMLIEAIEKCDEKYLQMIFPEHYAVHKRMPENIENTLLEKFEQYKIMRIGGGGVKSLRQHRKILYLNHLKLAEIWSVKRMEA